MNPLTNVRNITKLSERELKNNDGKTSWHDEYRDSAWVFIGGLPFELSEGDIVAVFSQYGEIVNLNLVRHKDTGKSRGFAFLCYEDQKSTVLAVDNFNGIKILGRTIRVDHVKDYKPPKDSDKLDDITKQLYIQGCGPGVELPVHIASKDQDKSEDEVILLPPKPSQSVLMGLKPELDYEKPDRSKRKLDVKESREKEKSKKAKKEKKKKSKKGKSKKHKKYSSSSSSEDSSSSSSSEHQKRQNKKSRK